jgi:hypothetical protein
VPFYSLALAHEFIMREAEPGEASKDLLLIFRKAARAVRVFAANGEGAAMMLSE